MKHIFTHIFLPLLFIFTTIMAQPITENTFTLTKAYTTNTWNYSKHCHYLSVNAGPDKNTKVGQAVHIEGSVSGVHYYYQQYVQYSWTLNGAVIANTATFDYIPTQAGVDTLKLEVRYFHYTASDTMKVTVLPSIKVLEVDAGTAKTTSLGTPITIAGTAKEGTPPYSYKWSSDGKILATTLQFEYPATQPGTYPLILTVTDSAGVTAIDKTSVQVKGSTLSVDAGEDKTVPQGSNISIIGKVTGGKKPYTYIWKRNNITIANTVSFDYNASDSGYFTFTLEVTDNKGITKVDNMTLYVEASTLTADAGEDKSTVEGSTITIVGDATGGTAPYTYLWKSNGTILSNTKSFEYNATQKGYHILELTVTDHLGIHKTDRMSIKVLNKPIELKVNAGEDQNITIDQPIYLYATAQGGTSPYQYKWSLNGVELSNTLYYYFVPTQAGQYNFTITVIDDTEKEATDTVLITVKDNVFPLKLSASASKHNITVNTTTTLTANVEGGTKPYTYEWKLDGDIIGTTQTLEYNATTSGQKTFTITVTDANQETKESTVSVQVNDIPQPLQVQAQVSDNNITVNTTTTLTANVEGGTKPYTYKWRLDGDIIGTTQTLEYNATTSGQKTFILEVTDANQETNESAITIQVNDAFQDLVVDAGDDKTTTAKMDIDIQGTIIEEGSGNYTYRWTSSNDPQFSANTLSFTYTPNIAGTYPFVLTVTDTTTGQVATDTMTLTVESAP